MSTDSIPKQYPTFEYLDDVNHVDMRFEIRFYSPGQIESFDFYYHKQRIVGLQSGRDLLVTFEKSLPRTLVDDLAWDRKTASQYVLGYVFEPLMRINKEMLRQRYSLGHFLVNTFSVFDIQSILVCNMNEEVGDEVIRVPWPPVFHAPPHQTLTGSHLDKPEAFITDYVDAWNDFFRGDYDNCIRRLVTSTESAVNYYGANLENTYTWWQFWAPRKVRTLAFKETLKRFGNDIGHAPRIVSDNLLFMYEIRNKIVHSSFRIGTENGWWLCGKCLKTVNYLFQHLDEQRGGLRGAYISSVYGFADFLFIQTRGQTLEGLTAMREFMQNAKHDESVIINTPDDMDRWQAEILRITPEEKISVTNHKNRK